MIPQSQLLRVCLSCWQRLPTTLARNIRQGPSIQRSLRFNKLLCSPICGQRWSRALTTTRSCMQEGSVGKKESVQLDLEQNQYFQKYRDKLKQLERTDPEEYRAKLKLLELREAEARSKRKQDLTQPPEPAETSTSPHLSKTWPPKSLDEIMKVDLIRGRTPAEIDQIWKEYHLTKDGVFSVVQEVDYDDLIAKSKTCPMFIYPLPRDDGFEFILSQFEGKNVHFTPLIMYQSMKENAPPMMTLAHFTELKKDKGLVLMAGRYDEKLLDRAEALILVRQLTKYYGKVESELFKYVHTFNHSPEKFHHFELIKEYKKMETSLLPEF